ncbi:hypothetical protein VDGE_30622 [Verticillium dahliae]|uniref:SnoaL-like domain-containing protein n=1 Tax=Verticillium dahliae TaxID=27337 RepID=A0A444RPD4_VERDA|nr:hypothetical protein VDGE_30622 [Verticillium dahliae]
MAFASSDEVLAAVLSKQYADYRHAPDIEARAAFISPHCRQICRPHPSYGASDRQAILEYLYEASGERPYDKTTTPIQQILQSQAGVPPGAKAYYTIRPLTQGELNFGNVPGDPHPYHKTFLSSGVRILTKYCLANTISTLTTDTTYSNNSCNAGQVWLV